MVGIFNKIGRFFGKVKDVVKDKVLPVVGKIGDFVDSDLVQGLSSVALPALNTAIPGLGSGLSMGMGFLSNLGKKARGISKEWNANPDYIEDKVREFSGVKKQNVPQGIQYAKRPTELHSRIKLKALPPAQDEYRGSYVEELPDDY